MTAPLIALDDFAGTGWGVACHRLGIDERGVEIMPEARATRAANGMTTVGADVWEHLAETAETPLAYDLLISSPPCQTFSMAGGGAGRRALDEVIGLIDDRAYTDVERLRAFGEAHDPRTALVLTPLVRVYRDAPTFVVLEQVPPVLPVWERIAVELRKWGYSVATGVLNAEQYGVPQTRRRAVLIARADGVEAKMPTPTHSRYYSRDPKRLDPGVLPWVSMAEALGWGMTARPFVTAGNAVGRAEGIGGSGGKAAVQREKDAGRWADVPMMHRHRGAGMDERHGERPGRPVDEPALTVTGNASGTTPGGFVVRADGEGLRGPWGMTERPYPTVATGAATAGGGTDPMALGGSGARKLVERERERGAWVELEQPATTVSGDSRIWPRGHKVNADDERRLGKDEARERYGDRAGSGAQRVTVEEAAALQSYPPGFDWQTGPNGKPLTKTKAFLQIGNAVPPLLAEAILRTIVETVEP